MSERKPTKKLPSPPLWEWILASLGAVLIIGALATVVYRAVTQSEAPAGFTVQVLSKTAVGENYAVNFRLTNVGSHTAGAVNVEGALMRGDKEVEKSSASIAYVPAGSEREGALFFTKDPAAYELAIRVTGYEKP